MSTPSATKAGATTTASAAASSSTAAALSNKDFRQFLTPLHPSMATKTATTTPVASSAAAAGSKTPAPRSSSSASSSGGAVKFATEETKTVKFTRKGVSDADGGDGGGEDDGEESSSGAGAGGEQRKGGKKGEPRVLSSRERSFIQFQQKQALKATAKVKYRDRTKERNQDANPDYAPEGGSEGGLGLGGAGGGMMAGEDPASLSIEASKYLGGDLAHTHLVKGLDFALLNKVRQELERNEEMKLEALVEAQHAAALAAKGKPNAATAAANAAVGAHKLASSATATTIPSIDEKATASKAALTPAQQAALNMTFGSSMASAIYRLTFDHAPTPSSSVAPTNSRSATAMPSSTAVTAAPATQTDLFLPGRMSFDFPLAPSSGFIGGLSQAQSALNALPTTSLTSRSDLDAFAQAYAEEHATALLPPKLHDNIVDIFERHHIAAEERRQKRKRGGVGAEGEHEQAGFNVEKTAPEVQKAAAAAALAAASAASSQNGVARNSGGEAASAAAAPADDSDALMYTVARPPSNDDDDDDDDIFAGAGSDYQAKLDEGAEQDEEPMYSVARPPPSPDSAPQASPPATATTTPLFARSAHEAPVPQLDARASRMQDEDEEDSEDEDDIFGASTRAGDELLGGVGADKEAKPLTAEQKRKARSERFAEAEYESLFPEHHTSYSTVLDEDDDDDGSGGGGGGEAPAEGSKKAKLLAEKAAQAEAKAKALAKAGRTPMRGAGPIEDIDEEMDAKKREAKFNAEYSQVALLLKARGVKLNDDAAARRSGAAAGSRASSGATPKPDDDERAIKRQRILKGFQK